MRTQYDLFPYIPKDFPLLPISQEALDRLLAQLADWAPLPEPVSALLEDLYPLSGMQAGLLFHSQANGLYVEQWNLRIEGALQVPVLIASWQQMLAAHPILRTGFVGQDVLAQVVWRTVPLPLTVIDATQLSPQEQAELLHAYYQADRRRGFVREQAPLLRLSLVRLGAQEHQFLWSFHHAILDGWSVSLLLHEFFARYQALAQGRQPHLPASRPYRDYIAWLQQQDQQAAHAFWRDELAGITTPTPLPLKASHALSQPDGEPSYGQQTRQLAPALSQRLQTVARRLHITLNTLVQASWAYVLSHYSGQEEVLFGMVVAGREAELVGAESLVGLCINTVPVRLGIPRAGTVADWLGQVHAHLGTLQRYSYYPLWQIQRLSDVDAGQSLFQSLLVFENYPVEQTVQQLQHSVLRLRPSLEEEAPERTNYALTATVVPDEQVQLSLSYQEQALEPELVSSMLAHWQQVLEAMVQQPDQRVADLPLVPEAEQELLLQEWRNGSQQSYPQTWFPQLFAQQVERSPDAVALICEQQQLTYRELNRRANQLAHHLQSLGVGPEVLVGLCMQPSPELIVGLLGILKAGGVYVPLEPDPRERLAFLLADTLMPVLLTQQQLLARFHEQPGQVVCLDRDWERIAQQSQANPVTEIRGQQLAYVMYTSGSTGQPKGVLIAHQAVAAHCWSFIEACELGAEDRVLQLHTFTFDTSLEQILPTLLVGARLLLHRQAIYWSPAELLKGIKDEALTVMDLPTAYWHQVAQEWRSEAAADLTTHLRLVTVGGERMLPQPLERWRHLPMGAVRLLNAYGPTETTITASLYDTADHAEGASSVESIPIGRPLPNRTLSILDRAGHPVPIGVAGELYIGGDMLARGYLNRPELTAECFVPDPFSRQPGARLYKTGDLVRYLPDGNLQFLGRIDQQVKIRGARVEVGEIESIFNAHSSVRESVVLAREETPGELRLVAYVVFHPEQTPNTEQLWTYLQEYLPIGMLPAQLIVLDALPLKANGKVDRQALLTRRSEEGEQQPHERQQPRDRIELQMLRIWERVLERGPISLTDNFFRLGGNSLTALSLHSLIQKEFQQELPLPLLFEYPTIRELALILRQEIGYVRGSALVPLQPHGSRAPFFCVHPGGGSVFCYLDLVRHLGMSYPVYGLQVPEVEKGQAIASVEQLAAHYIAALQSVQPEGPYRLGGWSAGGIIAYEMASQLRYQGHDVALLCLFDRQVPFGQRTQEHKHGSTLIKEFLVEWGFDEQQVSCLTEKELLRAAYDVFKQELMLPDGLDLAYVQRFIDIQHDISIAVEAYEPPCSDLRITLIRAEQEREHTSEAGEDGREPELDSTYGWSAVTTARVDVHSVPCSHHEMFREPYVQTVAATLRACLDERV